jgi:hypothetical protein
MDVTNPGQLFIWAKRNGPDIKAAPTESILGIHSQSGKCRAIVSFLYSACDEYIVFRVLIWRTTGSFQIDMTQSFLKFDNQSHLGRVAEQHTVQRESSLLPSIWAVHRVSLGSSFMVFFAISTMIIHIGNFKHAFSNHWICQVVLTIACFGTAIIVLMFTRNAVDVSPQDTLHVLAW